jgi:hypothetical protein
MRLEGRPAGRVRMALARLSSKNIAQSDYPGFKPALGQVRWFTTYFVWLVFVKCIRNFVVVENRPMREHVFGERFGKLSGDRIGFGQL